MGNKLGNNIWKGEILWHDPLLIICKHSYFMAFIQVVDKDICIKGISRVRDVALW